MFGLGKKQQTATTTVAAPAVAKEGGKGRPTPRRREAEQRNRKPVIGAPRVATNASKAERKAARQAQREASRLERLKQREALNTGDERHLPPRDKGPARRWARDYVDARRSPGEFFLPVALVVLLFSMLRLVPLVAEVSVLLLYVLGLVVGVDSFLLRRRVNRATVERFGEAKARGAGTYAMARALQMRRLRLPKPQVGRGQFPA